MTGVVDLEDGFVPVGTEVDGPQALEGVLSHWAQASDTPTVGKVGWPLMESLSRMGPRRGIAFFSSSYSFP
jgi:hypothetical protein